MQEQLPRSKYLPSMVAQHPHPRQLSARTSCTYAHALIYVQVVNKGESLSRWRCYSLFPLTLIIAYLKTGRIIYVMHCYIAMLPCHELSIGIDMSIRDVYEKKMQAQLDEWKTRLEVFKEKADQEETNLQLEYYTLIDEIKLELETAHKKLQLLKQAGDETWEEFKAEVETTWDALDELIRSLSLP